tara:strand:- start:319 stop:504 length:186 start_codon:yes stop_codon:yes gene_type:complete
MAKSLDKVLQPDGSWKWELVEPSLSERMGNGVEVPTACPSPEPKVTKKKTTKKKTTNPLSE